MLGSLRKPYRKILRNFNISLCPTVRFLKWAERSFQWEIIRTCSIYHQQLSTNLSITSRSNETWNFETTPKKNTRLSTMRLMIFCISIHNSILFLQDIYEPYCSQIISLCVFLSLELRHIFYLLFFRKWPKIAIWQPKSDEKYPVLNKVFKVNSQDNADYKMIYDKTNSIWSPAYRISTNSFRRNYPLLKRENVEISI